MQEDTQPQSFNYTKFIYESLGHQRTEVARDRNILVLGILTVVIVVSALIAGGWLALAISGIGVSLSYGVLGACGLHLFVIGIALLCAAALVMVHTLSMARQEEFESHWREILRTEVLSPQDARVLQGRLNDATPEIESKWSGKLRLATSASWSLGLLSGILFLASLVADVYVGATLEYTDACEDANYTLFIPTAPPHTLVQFNTRA